MNASRIMLVLAGLATVGGGMWWTYERQLAEPAESVAAEIAELEGSIESTERYLEAVKSYPDELREMRGRSLGSNPEQVIHRLRLLLRHVGESNGLQDVSADSRMGRGMSNPVAQSVRSFGSMRRQVALQPVSGTLRGVGSYEAALGAIMAVQEAGRLIRIDSIDLRPANRDTPGRLSLSLSVTTVFAPGFEPLELDDQRVSEWLGSPSKPAQSRLVEISSRESFVPAPIPQPAVVKQPPKPEQKRPPKVAPPEPPPPYHEWVITGVVERSAGAIVLVRNSGTREQRTLGMGESVLGLTFGGVPTGAGSAGMAIFKRGGQTARLRVGQNLGEFAESLGEQSR